MENNRECEDRMTVRRPFRMSFFALIFALILSSFQTLSAQNRKLEGTVFDEQGEPVYLVRRYGILVYRNGQQQLTSMESLRYRFLKMPRLM